MAPICGMPAVSRTNPAMLPVSLIGSTANAAGADTSRTANDPIVSLVRFLIQYDAGQAQPPAPPVLYFTVKLAVGVSTWFRVRSVTVIFKVYWPGSRLAIGNNFSTVTCWAEAPGNEVISSV